MTTSKKSGTQMAALSQPRTRSKITSGELEKMVMLGEAFRDQLRPRSVAALDSLKQRIKDNPSLSKQLDEAILKVKTGKQVKKPNYLLTPEQKEKLAGLRAEVKELVRNAPKPVVCVTPSSVYFSAPLVSTTSFVYSRSRQKPHRCSFAHQTLLNSRSLLMLMIPVLPSDQGLRKTQTKTGAYLVDI